MALIPGATPPMITPFCGICDMPVEKFCMDVVKSPYYIGLHCQCCGRTQSSRVSIDDAFEAKRTNAKVYGISSATVPTGIRRRARQSGHKH